MSVFLFPIYPNCGSVHFMNYYALQVKTRAEDVYIKRAVLSLSAETRDKVRFIFPRRKLTIRQRGENKTQIEPVFPGYIFMETENLERVLYWHLRTTPGFFRFLPENKDPKPLEGRDLALLSHFMSFGDVADKSKVRFDENDRIQILEGPLKGLEGYIVKVDRRKGRARVMLDMYKDQFAIDFAFEILGMQ